MAAKMRFDGRNRLNGGTLDFLVNEKWAKVGYRDALKNKKWKKTRESNEILKKESLQNLTPDTIVKIIYLFVEVFSSQRYFFDIWCFLLWLLNVTQFMFTFPTPFQLFFL